MDLVQALESSVPHASSSNPESSDIVVTTEATGAEAEVFSPSRDDLKAKPRGFFADQFEVGFPSV